ncbi:ABC transporter permease [Phytohabitans rumicis]|uniref:Peptide ABC transporter permease n=1 Tax=Phytohabitans rumicis TaxID=1076125 RepID=A0A6V8LGF6_9ACTN|nr:ABC transporter permease [Phytohabitans rumicis]GFJ96323.1 peptide ABC transporter permease [Phytohabitans rumicis]
MVRFIVRRLLFGVLVLWLISVAVFALFFVAPHDPARTIAGRQATPETVALVRHRLGLDQSVLSQYGHFLSRLLHGDLGYSYYNSEPVRSLIATRLPVTLSLTLGGAVLWLILGVGIGVMAARRPRSLLDRTATVFVLGGLSMPTFLVGLLLLYFLFFRLHLAGIDAFPGGGYVPLTQSPGQWAQHLVLPWLTLALVSAATYSRLTRAALLEVLDEDYIRTARSKGLSERRVIYRHALRSALTPVATQLGIDVGALLGGAIITENVFGLPGLGQLAVQSVTTQDLPVIVGIVLVASAFVVLANLAVDLTYAVLDPRVRPT